jgi:hypothetical protein
MSKERLTAEEMLEQAVKEYYTKPDAKDGIWDFTKNEVLYAMQSFAAQEVEAAIAERMPTKVDVIKLLKGYSWEYQEIFKDGCDWFRSRMEEKK